MTNGTTQPYVPANPGDLITAENWNALQVAVKNDIAAQVAAALASVKGISVDHATDSDELGGQTPDALTQAILAKLLAEIPNYSGYRRVLCYLAPNTLDNNNPTLPPKAYKIIEHNLKTYPLVDVYALEYFPMVIAKDDVPDDARVQSGLLYLYNGGDERRLRLPKSTIAIDIEEDPKSRILWKTLIDEFAAQKRLSYTDTTTLDDLEIDFWNALFAAPKDTFDPDAYGHSPWFEKCCGEKRTVADLTKHGDFDDIYLKVKPRKTVNATAITKDNQLVSPPPPSEPANVVVSQLDLDHVLLALEGNAVLPSLTGLPNNIPGTPPSNIIDLPHDVTKLPLLVLLKV